MKLIYCPECQDIVKLTREDRTCLCGKSHGRYLNDFDALYGGEAVPLFIDNPSFLRALASRPFMGGGRAFVAGVAPQACSTFWDAEHR